MTQNKNLQSFYYNKVLSANNDTGKINSSDDSSLDSERSK